MVDKRLNIYLEEGLRESLEEIATRKKTTLRAKAEEYIAAGIARDRGELIETESLPAIREAIAAEMNRAIGRLYQDLSDSMATNIKLQERKGDDRIIAMITKAIRNAGISRRLTHSLMIKQYGVEFAMKAFEDAKAKTGQDLNAHTNVDLT